jgi:ribosome-binding protein aMBF1 (putative translation factor)
MIRTENEYREAVARFDEERKRIEAQKAELKRLGLSAAEVKRAVDPIQSFHLQLQEEIESYQRLKRGEFDELSNLQGIGELLIAARIARGLTQRQLADKLGVHESQVSRDERNEYHGVALERAARILEVLGVELRSTVVFPGLDVLSPQTSALNTTDAGST